MAKTQIPVYLFTGFLESGKTTFAQETLEDESFNNGDRILLLLCEEGEEEYDPSAFAAPNIFIRTVESESELTEANLAAWLKKYRCKYVMVEYNGMWGLDSLYNNMPEGWAVAQEFFFIDSTTFETYNANMRQLMVDKLKSCELVVFNRFPAEDNEELKMTAHKVVRAINRRCDIAFETPDHKISYDDIELPPPYDLNAPVVQIGDEDYAIFYQELQEKLPNYDGKVVKLRAQIITKTRQKLKKGYFFLGRQIMTCCANDVQYVPLAAEWSSPESLTNMGWYMITARIDVRELEGVYNGPGPVLHVTDIAMTDPPVEEVATYY